MTTPKKLDRGRCLRLGWVCVVLRKVCSQYRSPVGARCELASYWHVSALKIFPEYSRETSGLAVKDARTKPAQNPGCLHKSRTTPRGAGSLFSTRGLVSGWCCC